MHVKLFYKVFAKWQNFITFSGNFGRKVVNQSGNSDVSIGL
jgi:hypothetical protein